MASQREFIDIIRTQMAESQLIFTHSPERWAACVPPVDLKWKPIQFTKDNVSKIPSTKGGIYGFLLRPSFTGPPETAYLLYVGRATRFRTRYRRYLRDQSPTGLKRRPIIHEMLNKWPEDTWFYFATIDDLSLLPKAESAIRDSCIPPFNSDFDAQVSTAVRMWRSLGAFRS